jgi:hypothetical protein
MAQSDFRGKIMTARMMEHEEAMKNLVAERYLLGELTENDRDAYDEHLFSCPVCFEQVGTEFVGHLRRMGTEEPRPAVVQPVRPLFLRMFRPAPAFALIACLLAGATLYQNMTIAMLKAPQVELRYQLSEQSRGNSAVNIVQAPRNSRVRLVTEFRRPKEFASYEVQIQTPDGNIKHRFPFSPLPSEDKVEFSLYAGTLQTGKYVLVVQGKDGDSSQELARDSFTMQLRD